MQGDLTVGSSASRLMSGMTAIIAWTKSTVRSWPVCVARTIGACSGVMTVVDKRARVAWSWTACLASWRLRGRANGRPRARRLLACLPLTAENQVESAFATPVQGSNEQASSGVWLRHHRCAIWLHLETTGRPVLWLNGQASYWFKR